MVYSRETAAEITIVANATTYNAQVDRLICFVTKQGKATIWLQTRAEKGIGYELGTGFD